jgi:hypothetical protein
VTTPGDPVVDDVATVPLHAEHDGPIDVAAARAALADPSWLGDLVDGPPGQPGVRRIAADLELPVRDGSATGPVRKSAFIDLGPPESTDDRIRVAVGWQSATLAPLFPVFSGELVITSAGLALDGRYAPPFGRVGLVIDSALLNFIARRTAQAFVARLAARFGG